MLGDAGNSFGQWIPRHPVVNAPTSDIALRGPSRSEADCSAVDSQPIDISRIRNHFAATNHPPTVLATVNAPAAPPPRLWIPNAPSRWHTASPLVYNRRGALPRVNLRAYVHDQHCWAGECHASQSARYQGRYSTLPLLSYAVQAAALTHRSRTRTCPTSQRCTRSGRRSSASCARTRASPPLSP